MSRVMAGPSPGHPRFWHTPLSGTRHMATKRTKTKSRSKAKGQAAGSGKKASAKKTPSRKKAKKTTKKATKGKATGKRVTRRNAKKKVPRTNNKLAKKAETSAKAKTKSQPEGQEAPAVEEGARKHAAPKPGRRYYLTTAIAYPNGPPHIGHAYEAIATDAIARFMRLDGYDVFFLTGTDEHGIKMLQTANKEGLTPRALVERNVPLFEKMVARLNCSNDDFIHTTERRHHLSSAAIWERMHAAGDIYQSKYSGWYSVRDEAYYDESETRLTEGGVRLGPQGTPVEWVEEDSYFFRLSAFQRRLLDHYAAHPDFVLPKERFNEVLSFVKGGLQDLSVSRTTFDWGIPVPGAPGHIIYVWVDALTNYITAAGFPKIRSKAWKTRWPADIHIIGKDILRFHAVYWPAFLMSAKVALPKRVFAHGFVLNLGEKMSKSVGNVVGPFEMVERYGTDALRYFLLREVQFGQDGSYSHEAIVNRINADLANDLGNLAQRCLSMVAKYCGGMLPGPGPLAPQDEALLAQARLLPGKSRGAMKNYALHTILADIWRIVGDANRYFASEEPWAKRKSDPVRMQTILFVTADVLRIVAIMVQPFMPSSMGKLLDLLGVAGSERHFAKAGALKGLTPGALLPPPVPVFPRYSEPEETLPPGAPPC